MGDLGVEAVGDADQAEGAVVPGQGVRGVAWGVDGC